jgi:hypothetical protein
MSRRWGLLLSNRSVLDAPRDDVEIAGTQPYFAVPELDGEVPFEDEEEIVGLRMRMPDELSLDLDHDHIVPVELCDDLRRPVVRKGRELLGQTYSGRHNQIPSATALDDDFVLARLFHAAYANARLMRAQSPMARMRARS